MAAINHGGIADSYMDQNQFRKAIPHYKELIRLEPDFANAHANLGYSYQQTFQFQDSNPFLRAAIPESERVL